MGRPILGDVNGLYALKPWYAGRLAGIRARLAAAEVAPSTVSVAGVVLAAVAAAALAAMPAGPGAGLVVSALLAARLACANLDGGLARASGRCTPRGAVVNEVSDRAADLVVLAGFLAVAPVALVSGAALTAMLPSWVSLAGAAAGAPRLQGGPVGKSERAVLAAVAALTGGYAAVLAVVAAGSALTAGLRLRRLHLALGGGR